MHKNDSSPIASREVRDFYRKGEDEGKSHFCKTSAIRLDYDAFLPFISKNQLEEIPSEPDTARWNAMNFLVSDILKSSHFLSEFRERYGIIALFLNHKIYSKNPQSAISDADPGTAMLICIPYDVYNQDGQWKEQPIENANAKFFAFAVAKGFIDETHVLNHSMSSLGMVGIKFKNDFLSELEILKKDGVQKYFSTPLQCTDRFTTLSR